MPMPMPMPMRSPTQATSPTQRSPVPQQQLRTFIPASEIRNVGLTNPAIPAVPTVHVPPIPVVPNTTNPTVVTRVPILSHSITSPILPRRYGCSQCRKPARYVCTSCDPEYWLVSVYWHPYFSSSTFSPVFPHYFDFIWFSSNYITVLWLCWALRKGNSLRPIWWGTFDAIFGRFGQVSLLQDNTSRKVSCLSLLRMACTF
jgi:hypothetical protein